MTRSLGWLPPTAAEPGSTVYAARPAGSSVLAGVEAGPSSWNVDLLPEHAFDQGALASCVGNATASSIIAAHVEGRLPDIVPSRLGIWQRALSFYGRFGRNEGIQICTALDLCAKMGTPTEDKWPYYEDRLGVHPGPEVDVDSFAWKGKLAYHPVSSWGDALIADLERACYARFVVPFGVPVSFQFCSLRPSGTVHAPQPGDFAGNHAMVLVGHDRASERFLVRNSWGDDAGDPALPPGYFWMGYDYARRAADIWLVSAKGGEA